MGKKLTTGRYETREELVEQIWKWWDMKGTTIPQIASVTRVSETTVRKILDAGRPNNKEEDRATRP